ncbi:MAG: peptidylprolyl isomerase [Limisphaerales bacterium]
MKTWMWICLVVVVAAGAIYLCYRSAYEPINQPAGSSASTPAATPGTSETNPPEKTASGQTDYADPSKLTATAPDNFDALFNTTKGKFIVFVNRSLAPNGADRFYNLVHSGYFTDIAFFRVIPGFMCQFGINGDPNISAAWREAAIPDDPVKGSNTRGTITFATSGPNSRTTQLFINFADNTGLDTQGFAPFGKVVEGMDVVDKINGEYGEGAPSGRGPDQGAIQQQGNDYLKKNFPDLDYIKSASIVPISTNMPAIKQ